MELAAELIILILERTRTIKASPNGICVTIPDVGNSRRDPSDLVLKFRAAGYNGH